jgi:hypothetical protein
VLLLVQCIHNTEGKRFIKYLLKSNDLGYNETDISWTLLQKWAYKFHYFRAHFFTETITHTIKTNPLKNGIPSNITSPMHIVAFSGSSQVQTSDFGNSYFLKIRRWMNMHLVGMLLVTVVTLWVAGVYWQLLFYEPLPLFYDIPFLSQLYTDMNSLTFYNETILHTPSLKI